MTEGPLSTEEKSVVQKLRERADRWQPWIDDDLEAEVGYLPDHMRYHQALDRQAADEIDRLRAQLRQIDAVEGTPRTAATMKVGIMAALARQGLT